MEVFKSLSRYEITGRGTVFIVESNSEFEHGKCPLIGQKVIIDDEVFLVKNVETFAIPVIQKGITIGLLIENEFEQEEQDDNIKDLYSIACDCQNSENIIDRERFDSLIKEEFYVIRKEQL